MFVVSRILDEFDTSVMSNVYRDNNMEITSIPNWGPQKILCFSVKIFPDGIDNWNNHKFCRISMTEPKYIGVEGEDLILSKQEIDKLIRILNEKNRRNSMTNWEYLIYEQNWEHAEYDDEWENIDTLPIPDYTKLSENNKIFTKVI